MEANASVKAGPSATPTFSNGSGRLAALREGTVWFFVVVGVLLRVLEYTDQRSLYKDEVSLLENLVGLPILDFHTTLTEEQLAPPGFLVLERVMVRIPVDARWSGRFFPLVCAVASVFWFRRVARDYAAPRAVPIAQGLFALADWLLYYASEIKQYSTDVLLALIALDLTARIARAEPGGSRRGALVKLAVLGFCGVWFSYTLVFVLATVGIYLAATAPGGLKRPAPALLSMGAGWCASFFVCYRVSHRILSKGRFIWDWWDFAFLPLPPRTVAQAEQVFWQLVNVFNSPADLVTPLGILASALLASALFLIGLARLGRRWPGGAWLLVGPILVAVAASALHQYPFHGRLLLFLTPAVHLLAAEGAVALAFVGWPAAVVLGTFMLAQPTLDVLHHRLIMRRHRPFDSHGDIRPDLLDHFEALRHKPPGS